VEYSAAPAAAHPSASGGGPIPSTQVARNSAAQPRCRRCPCSPRLRKSGRLCRAHTNKRYEPPILDAGLSLGDFVNGKVKAEDFTRPRPIGRLCSSPPVGLSQQFGAPSGPLQLSALPTENVWMAFRRLPDDLPERSILAAENPAERLDLPGARHRQMRRLHPLPCSLWERVRA
jgi:hypothetical protein